MVGARAAEGSEPLKRRAQNGFSTVISGKAQLCLHGDTCWGAEPLKSSNCEPRQLQPCAHPKPSESIPAMPPLHPAPRGLAGLSWPTQPHFSTSALPRVTFLSVPSPTGSLSPGRAHIPSPCGSAGPSGARQRAVTKPERFVAAEPFLLLPPCTSAAWPAV